MEEEGGLATVAAGVAAGMAAVDQGMVEEVAVQGC
tara:strand:+ start:326 stop:430 length:105 start_codon:yes stop_codon:yes gene_type:complete